MKPRTPISTSLRWLLPLAALGTVSCSASRPPVAPAASTAPAPAPTLASLDAELERLMSAHSLAEWHSYTGEETVPEGTLDRLRAEEQALFERARPLAEQVLARADASPAERRRATLWRDGALGLALEGDPEIARLAHQLEAEVNGYVFTRGGQRLTRSDLRRLSTSRDPAERRAAHELNAGLHRSVADIARALLRRRVAVARAHGGLSYGDAMLRLRGIEPARWDALSTALLQGTQARYAAVVAQGARAAGLTRVTPWDATLALSADLDWTDARLHADDALPFARRALATLGFDLDQPPVRVVVREFAFGGQTLAIRVPDDVRAVVRPQDGHRFYRTLLHELGHALQATRTTATEAVLKGYEWVPGLISPGYDEGIAEVFGLLMEQDEFLARHTDLTAAERTRLLTATRQNALVSLRLQLARVAFERMALADPEQDLDALERRLDREIRGLEVPEDAPPTWAGTPFLATYPMYTQSYVLAAMVAAQTHAALKQRFGTEWLSPATGRFLTETMFAQGEALPWDERLQAATGRSLAPDDLIALLNAR